jgi:hypothetical protein
MKRQELIRRLESHGLSFTVNVILNGCSKPMSKLKTLQGLINNGHDVVHSSNEVYAILIDGQYRLFSVLDKGIPEIENDLNTESL